MSTRGRADAGLTLIELVVAMALTGIFTTIFTAGIAQIYTVANRSDSTSIVQSQLNAAFLRLDRQIRYAADIAAPGTVTANGFTNIYVEYKTVTDPANPVCGELRLQLPVGQTVGQLQLRTWPDPQPPPQGFQPPGFVTLASGISATTPFTRYPADTTSNFERLELAVTASSGSAGTQSSRLTDITFTAANSQMTANGPPADATDCTQWRT